jgi:hypothetical protein
VTRTLLFRAAAAATLLAVASAAPLSAVTWGGNRALTASGGGYAYRGGLAVTSATVVNAIYEQYTPYAFSVWVRRSSSSGTSWGTPIRLSRPGVGEAGVPSIDAVGNAVDAVWVEGDDIINGFDSIVVYRRSTDGGVTWLDPIQISSTTGRAGFPRVVHASGGRVVVTWTDEVSGVIYVRVSTNSGASFGGTRSLSTTTNKPLSNTALREGWPSPAAGSGGIFVAYYSATHTLKYRRSADGGSTWASAKTLATNGEGFEAPSIATIGSTVVAGYAINSSGDFWTVIRRSTDKGAHWGSVVQISPQSSYPSFSPALVYRSSAFRIVYERCNSNSCSTSDTWYRTSSTGATWSTASKASARHRQYDYPADVDVATKVLVMYTDYKSTQGGDVYVRQGS